VFFLKPSEIASNCSRALVDLFDRYLDKECFRAMEGGPSVAKALTHEKWDLIIFTGSSDKGKKVAAAAGANLVPVILELGGKNPAIVDKDANLETAALRIAHTKHLNWGATCVSPDYIIAHRDIKDQLIQQVVKAVHQFYGDDPQKSEDKVCIIGTSELERIQSLLNESHGGRVVIGGKVDVEQRYIAPTIIDEPNRDSRLMNEEIFGPILPVVSFSDINEVIADLKKRPKPLALYYFGNLDNPNKDKIISQTSSGGVCVNDCTNQGLNSNLPFGGVGDSGFGALHGKWGFDACSHLKAVVEKVSWEMYPWSTRFPPYTPARQVAFMRVVNLFGGLTQKKLRKRFLWTAFFGGVFFAYRFGKLNPIASGLRRIWDELHWRVVDLIKSVKH